MDGKTVALQGTRVCLSEMSRSQGHVITKISISFDDAASKDYIFISSGETKIFEHDRESADTLLIFAAV